MDDIYQMIGTHFTYLRTLSGKTQESVACDLGLARSTYVNIENGARSISLERIYQIAAYYDEPITKVLPEMCFYNLNL